MEGGGPHGSLSNKRNRTCYTENTLPRGNKERREEKGTGGTHSRSQGGWEDKFLNPPLLKDAFRARYRRPGAKN